MHAQMCRGGGTSPSTAAGRLLLFLLPMRVKAVPLSHPPHQVVHHGLVAKEEIRIVHAPVTPPAVTTFSASSSSGPTMPPRFLARNLTSSLRSDDELLEAVELFRGQLDLKPPRP